MQSLFTRLVVLRSRRAAGDIFLRRSLKQVDNVGDGVVDDSCIEGAPGEEPRKQLSGASGKGFISDDVRSFRLPLEH